MDHKPEYESINFLLSMICKAQRTQMNGALTAIDLYAGQEMFLWHLWREDGLTQTQMVERVQPPTVSKMLERMEKAGLVTRRSDPEDSRVSRVYLTEQGRRSEQAVRDIWKTIEQRITAGLSVEERVLLRHLLLHVHENVTRNP
jgi:MarR family transcriptional regulator, organic hydroperoxide resistance regulator